MPDSSIDADMYYFYDQLKFIRKKAGKSQEDIADELQIGTSTVWRMEHGLAPMSIKQMLQYCESCGLPINTLFPRKYLTTDSTVPRNLSNILDMYQTLSPKRKQLAFRLIQAIVKELREEV